MVDEKKITGLKTILIFTDLNKVNNKINRSFKLNKVS